LRWTGAAVFRAFLAVFNPFTNTVATDGDTGPTVSGTGNTILFCGAGSIAAGFRRTTVCAAFVFTQGYAIGIPLGFTAKYIVKANAGFAGTSTATGHREFGASIRRNNFDAKSENVAGISDGAFATLSATSICATFFVGAVRGTATHALTIGGAELAGGAESTEVATSIGSTHIALAQGFAYVLFAGAFSGTEISCRANATDISTSIGSTYLISTVWRTGGFAETVLIADLALLACATDISTSVGTALLSIAFWGADGLAFPINGTESTLSAVSTGAPASIVSTLLIDAAGLAYGGT